MSRFIYLDNAATTRLKEEVYEAMQSYLKEWYGNASSIYSFAGKCKKAIEDARGEVKKVVDS